MLSVVLLALTVLLSTLRHIISKKISRFPFGTRAFYLLQSVIFLSGAILLAATCRGVPSLITVLLALLYGAALISAQYFYTAALSVGDVSICATVYSLGFIIPTLSGTIFWNEKLTVIKALGILAAIFAVLLSGAKKSTKEKSGYYLPLIISMLSSGALGVLQKLQQRVSGAGEASAFVMLAFLAACLVSFLFLSFSGAERQKNAQPFIKFAILIGCCFGGCNLLNTLLAGRLPSAVFFPSLNISSIVLSVIMSVLFFKEKLTGRKAIILAISFLAILLLNI